MLSSTADTQVLKSVRVLIVEDEYILARNLREILGSFGYTVVGTANSGKTAIAKAIELRPRIILMDIQIQGDIDGIQAAEQIWQRLKIPIIYVTGHSDYSTVQRATLTYPFGYILKPIREQELYVAIQTALSRYEHEQFFRAVLQEMGDGVIVVDAQLRIKYLNAAAEMLTGWSLDEVKEQRVTETIPFLDEQGEHPIEHPILSVLATDAPAYLNTDALLVRKSGPPLLVIHSAAFFRNNEGVVAGAVLVFRDNTQRWLATERDRANERAQQSEQQLAEQRRLNQLKDDFLATTSHELRTPLSNIKLAICLLETLLNKQCALEDEPNSATAQSVKRYLSVLREQCDQELRLVSDLLDLRSLEAGSYLLKLTPIPLATWLPALIAPFQERIEARKQILQVSIPADLPLIRSDQTALTRILSELLNNACKYTPRGETIAVSAALVLNAPTPALEIVIRNSGVEIPPEQQAHIFDPFYRIPSRDPWKHSGMGLGLALIKRLLTQLQGTISVTSLQGWTAFTLRLPLALTPLPKDTSPA